ncbi:MAG: hypothetical protein KJN63_05365 [Acidimicrobiia bacterium]|nr:hypothetical protein [Acidimicrobiia bacterium]
MANPQTPNDPSAAFTQALSKAQQASGAIGVLTAVAQLVGLQSGGEEDQNVVEGAFAQLLSTGSEPCFALGLASVAELALTVEGRADASNLLEGRRHHLSGLARTYPATTVGRSIAVSNEFRDVDAVCIELLISGSRPITLVADYDRVWVQLSHRIEVVDAPLRAVVDSIGFDDSPGSPRRIERTMSETELRRSLWWLAHGDTPQEGSEIGWTYLRWILRLLDIDTTVAGLSAPEVQHDFEEEETAELFRESTFGQNWARSAYSELLDHIISFDFDGDVPPLCWSPRRVAHLLTSRVGFFDGEHAAALPELLRNWVRFCAEQTGQRKPLLKQVLVEIDQCASDFYRELGEWHAA